MPNSIKSKIRQTANRLLEPLGLYLTRRDRTFDMQGMLARAANRHVQARTIIDIGASDGSWSVMARRYFPESHYLLFEPLIERKEALDRLKQRYGFDYISAATGSSEGTIAFNVEPSLDGSGIDLSNRSTTARVVPVITIDGAVSARSLPANYILKLDTHGYEIPILEGAVRTLEQTCLLIIECYNFPITPGCLVFHELCAWLNSRGFRCIDLADPTRRPKDSVFWQMDLAFAPASDAAFASNSYTISVN